MWHLRDSFPMHGNQATALNHGVGVYSLRSAVAFGLTRTPYSKRSLVLGYPALPEEQIREAIARVARALVLVPRCLSARRTRISLLMTPFLLRLNTAEV